MDADSPDASRRSRSLEDTLTSLDLQLGNAEKQVTALLKTARRLRRSASLRAAPTRLGCFAGCAASQ